MIELFTGLFMGKLQIKKVSDYEGKDRKTLFQLFK